MRRLYIYFLLTYFHNSLINDQKNKTMAFGPKAIVLFFWSFICHNCTICVKCVKGKGSPYSITERRVQS